MVMYASALEFVPHRDGVLLPEHIAREVAIREPHQDSHGEPVGDVDAESYRESHDITQWPTQARA